MRLGGPLNRPGQYRVQKLHLLLPEIKPHFLRCLARSLVPVPTELPQIHVRIFQTLRSGDLASYVLLHIPYSIFLSMDVSDVSGAELSCGGMTMVLVAEGEIRSWPVTVV
jgi:hypothetical protein